MPINLLNLLKQQQSTSSCNCGSPSCAQCNKGKSPFAGINSGATRCPKCGSVGGCSCQG